jgi:hypothetical protein
MSKALTSKVITLLLAGLSIKSGRPATWVHENINSKAMYVTVPFANPPFSFAYGITVNAIGSPYPFTEHIAVAYHDSSGALVFSKRILGTWQTEVIDSAGDVGHSPSLALDPAGFAHIVYIKKQNGTDIIRYAKQLPPGEQKTTCGSTPSQWTCGAIPTGYDDPRLVAIGVDHNMKLHVAYSTLSNTYYLSRPNGVAQWSSENAYYQGSALSQSPVYLALKVDSQQSPQISLRINNGPLVWLRKTSGNWQVETVDASTNPLESERRHAMALGPNDQPNLLFLSPSDGFVLARRLLPGGWSRIKLNGPGNMYPLDAPGVESFGLAIDQDNSPRISYYTSDGSSFKYARWVYLASSPGTLVPQLNAAHDPVRPHAFFSQGWAKMDIDSGFNIAYWNQIALGFDGNPLVVYYDWNLGYFRFARLQ